MPEILTFVGKGRFFQLVDEKLRVPTQKGLDELKGGRGLFDLGVEASIIQGSEGDRHHIEVEVLGGDSDNDAWWPAIPEKEKILRTAYCHAYEIALAHDDPKPIVTLWVRGITNEQQEVFEMYVEETELEVHVIWVTSGTKGMGNAPATENTYIQRLWKIGTDQNIDQTWARYPTSGEYANFEGPMTIPGFEGIKVLNLPSY